MDFDDFRVNAASFDLESGWEIFGEIIKSEEPSFENLLRVIKDVQVTNPDLGNLIFIEAKLNICLEDNTPNDFLLKTLEDFEKLEAVFKETENEAGLEIIEILKEEYDDILLLLEDNIARA